MLHCDPAVAVALHANAGIRVMEEREDLEKVCLRDKEVAITDMIELGWSREIQVK